MSFTEGTNGGQLIFPSLSLSIDSVFESGCLSDREIRGKRRIRGSDRYELLNPLSTLSIGLLWRHPLDNEVNCKPTRNQYK